MGFMDKLFGSKSEKEIKRIQKKVDDILAQLRAMDEETPNLGIRAFVWNVEKHY